MDSKTQFLSSKDITSWWASVSSDTRFDMVLLYACGCAIEGLPSAEQREGALKMKEILLTLSQTDEPPVKFVHSGLKYNTEPKSRTLKPAPKTETK
jgi:hypothetical protein